MKQVDNFAVPCQDRETAQAELSLLTQFNGVNITQTRHYIKMSNAFYLKKIFQNHAWLEKDEFPPATFPIPIKADAQYARDLETADPFMDQECHVYKNQIGFTYQEGIGEVIYTLVTCQPDISFAAIIASQFLSAPAKKHVDALQDLFSYG